MTHLRALTPDAARGDRSRRDPRAAAAAREDQHRRHARPQLDPARARGDRARVHREGRRDRLGVHRRAGRQGEREEGAALDPRRGQARARRAQQGRPALAATETAEVITFIGGELGELVEAIVPFSARARRSRGSRASERRGRQLERARRARSRSASSSRPASSSAMPARACSAASSPRRTRSIEMRRASARPRPPTRRAPGATSCSRPRARSPSDAVLAERKALSEQTSALYRRAAREVLDLVRPRRLPFSSHTATAADRDYLIALLSSGFETAIEAGRRRVADDLLARSQHRGGRSAHARDRARRRRPRRSAAHRGRSDRPRAVARVRSRPRVPARLPRGWLRRGVLPQRRPAPRARRGRRLSRARARRSRISIASSASPSPAPRAMRCTALAGRLDHWGAVVDVQAFDLEVGIGRALELRARLGYDAARRCRARCSRNRADARDRRGRPRARDRSDGDGGGRARFARPRRCSRRKGLRDSKAYGAGEDAHAIRCELAGEIRARALFVATIEVEHTEIDERVSRGELNVLERELAAR